MLQPHRKVSSLHLFIRRKAGNGYCFFKIFFSRSLSLVFYNNPIILYTQIVNISLHVSTDGSHCQWRFSLTFVSLLLMQIPDAGVAHAPLPVLRLAPAHRLRLLARGRETGAHHGFACRNEVTLDLLLPLGGRDAGRMIRPEPELPAIIREYLT